VRGVAKLKIVNGGGATGSIRDDMVEFEESRFAAAPMCSFKLALPAVTRPDGPFDLGGNMTRAFSSCHSRARSIRNGDPFLLQVSEQQRNRPLEDHGRVTIRNAMTQQVLHSPQLLVRLATNGELYFVSFRGEWRDLGPRE
jgi:hypothetical protein